MAPRPTRGRRPEREHTALRERIEALLLQGLPATAIHRALTGPEAPAPIILSARQVRAHMLAIEHTWARARAPRQPSKTGPKRRRVWRTRCAPPSGAPP